MIMLKSGYIVVDQENEHCWNAWFAAQPLLVGCGDSPLEAILTLITFISELGLNSETLESVETPEESSSASASSSASLNQRGRPHFNLKRLIPSVN